MCVDLIAYGPQCYLYTVLSWFVKALTDPASSAPHGDPGTDLAYNGTLPILDPSFKCPILNMN